MQRGKRESQHAKETMDLKKQIDQAKAENDLLRRKLSEVSIGSDYSGATNGQASGRYQHIQSSNGPNSPPAVNGGDKYVNEFGGTYRPLEDIWEPQPSSGYKTLPNSNGLVSLRLSI